MSSPKFARLSPCLNSTEIDAGEEKSDSRSQKEGLAAHSIMPPHSVIADGTVFSKQFDEGLFEGTVSYFDPKNGHYRVVYLDGDAEDVSKADMRRLIAKDAKRKSLPLRQPEKAESAKGDSAVGDSDLMGCNTCYCRNGAVWVCSKPENHSGRCKVVMIMYGLNTEEELENTKHAPTDSSAATKQCQRNVRCSKDDGHPGKCLVVLTDSSNAHNLVFPEFADVLKKCPAAAALRVSL
jgi:hypothetical protein